MEEWMDLPGYPGYEASDQGRIRNERGWILGTTQIEGARPFVALSTNGRQVQRGLALLICQTFLETPRADFNTPIHLDGDLANCRVSNLAWRPRWFALKHTRQFRLNLGESGAVRNIDTGIVYKTIWDVVFTFGVLYNEVVKSIINKTWVFPIYHRFEWIDPE